MSFNDELPPVEERVSRFPRSRGNASRQTCAQLLPELKEILPEAFEKRIKRVGIVNAWNDANFKKAVEDTKRHNLIFLEESR